MRLEAAAVFVSAGFAAGFALAAGFCFVAAAADFRVAFLTAGFAAEVVFFALAGFFARALAGLDST